MSELDARLRDEIDDQVAEAFDAYLAERRPRNVFAIRWRGGVVVATILIGAAATLVAQPVVGCALWLAITVTNVMVLGGRG